MPCKVKYIETEYREDYPKLADRLTDIYHSIWKSITESNLFRKYGTGDNATYLFSKAGTQENAKQLALINEINKKYNSPLGKSLISSKLTKAGNNASVQVNVHPLAQQEYDKLNPPTLFQLSGTESSKASPQTLKIVKDFLTRIGVSTEGVKDIVVNGIKADANAVALITQKLVQVTEGKEDVALTEEAMHFAVEIIQQKDPKLFNQLLKEINDYNILKETFATYSSDPNYQTKDGKPDVIKIKKEAIGKVLAEVIINQSEGITEKPELLAKAESWWKKLINSIKAIFQKSGFDTAAMDILSGKNIGTVEDVVATEGEAYLQKAQPATQDSIIGKLKDVQATIVKKDDGYYIAGSKILNRVSDFVQDWYTRRFNTSDINKSEFQTAVDDLKAEKGTAGHADLEHIQKLFVDDDGYLRDEELDDTNYVSQLDPNDNTAYKLLKNNLRERLESFPPNTRFMAEVMIYDGKNTAGTIDFLAITSTGKVSILDWKFTDINVDKHTDVPWYKVAAWNLQMEKYKEILEKNYSIKPENFEQTRMIPIKTYYTKGDIKNNILPHLTEIEIGDVNVKNITDDYLLPVGLESEKTGNKKLDDLLAKLRAEYKAISEKGVPLSEKANKAEQLNSLFTAIRQLQMRQNIAPLVQQAKILNKTIQKTIDTFNDTWVGTDPMSYDDAALTKFQKELLDAKKALSIYLNLDIDLKRLFSGDLTAEEKELKDDLKDVVENARTLAGELDDVNTEFARDFNAAREEAGDITLPEKIIKGIARLFGTPSTLQMRAMGALFKKANRALDKAKKDSVDEVLRLAELEKAYNKLAISKGLNRKDYFNLIKKSNKNELIDQYEKEFYIELKKKIEEKDQAWISDNIDVAAYREFLKEKLEEEYNRIENKARVGTDEQIVNDIVRERSKAFDLYNISTPTSPGWSMYDSIKKFPKSSWESTEWKELNQPANKAAKDFYDYILERNNYYQSIGYLNRGEARVFLPWVRKDLMEKLITGGDVSLGESFLRSISMDEGDIGFGSFDPRTGEIVNTIPKYFTHKLEGEVSDDLFKTMALYNEMAIKFKYLSDIEGQALGLLDIERNKGAIATSVFGKSIYKDGVLEITKDNSKNANLLDNMIKSVIYGQKYLQDESFDHALGTIGNFGKVINDKLGMKILPENLAGRQISANKVINNINNFFQLKTMGLSLLSPTSNLFGGSVQALINAGKYYTKNDYIESEMWINSKMLGGASEEERKKFVGALDYFLPLTENYSKEFAKKLSVNKLNQQDIQDALYFLMRHSDKHVQTVNFRSFIKNSIVINGEVINAREYLKTTPEYSDMYAGNEEERKALADKYEEDVKKIIEDKGVLKVGEFKDGKFVLPGVDRKSDSVIEITRKVQKITSDAMGTMTEENKRLLNMTVYGSSFMLFKNWIPRLVEVRMGGLIYNSASDAYEWGRMRSVFAAMSPNVLKSLSNLRDSLVGNDKGVEFMKDLYEKKKEEYEKETGKTFEMSSSEFLDMFRTNVRNQMYDVIAMTLMVGLYMGLKANAPDKDENETVRNQYKFLLRAADKLRDEITYFYDPSSFSQLISSGIFPSVQLITNFEKIFTNFMQYNFGLLTGNDDLVKNAHTIKYVMKTFPIANQMQQYLPMVFPDIAKNLGIQMQSSSGMIR
jgi:hypothetical protein